MTAPSPATVTDPTAAVEQWRPLVESQHPVGDCHRPRCGGKLRALPPTIVAGVVWLEAECDTCHTGVGLPDGRRADIPRTLRPVRDVPAGDWRARQAKDP